MAHRRPGMSTTLPRNFAYNSSDGGEPRTPEQTFAEIRLPSPPHHSTCRFRRPRFDFSDPSSDLPSLHASDIPIPSIELPRKKYEQRPSWQLRANEPSPCLNFHLSARPSMPVPKTPPAQTQPTHEQDPPSAWAIERPSSSCSNVSDSSISSEDSFTSPPSFGGSCTSPESDFQDPFTSTIKSIPGTPSRPSKARSNSCLTPQKPQWTIDMDNHLWNTYQIYLQDPTITPFKMVPGSVPPLGVSHRVAREAKKTWTKALRIPGAGPKQQNLRDTHDDTHTTVRNRSSAEPPSRSGSSTPTMPSIAPPKSSWPRESATRRRLKELCKRKFSIAPHYQRLLQSRSPSPFSDQASRRVASRSSNLAGPPTNPTVSYATRDLSISLASAGASTQLAQLATDVPDEKDEDGWFNSPPEPISSPPTCSQHVPGIGSLEPPSSVPRLGSPFIYKTWGPGRSRHQPRPTTPPGQSGTSDSLSRNLLSPMHLDANANKRRAAHQLEAELSPGGSDIQTRLQADHSFLNVEPSEYTLRRVRLRNRGVTLGASSGRDTLNKLFNPPQASGESSNSTSAYGPTLAPPVEQTKRLGSPFELTETRNIRNRSPRHGSSMSDPFISNPFVSQAINPSINETLATFDRPEDGLSDAERIRRQILNLHRR